MPLPALSLRELEALAAVARESSFAAAARTLGTTRADVSRVVARIERRLDLRLFTRSTRQVVPTDAARRLAARLDPALAEIGAALAAAAEREHGMSGPIRVSCSHALGRLVLLPLLAEWRAAHPRVELMLSLSDRIDDLLARELDLSLRLGPLPPSSMVARRLGRLALALVAPPALAPGAGPLTPEALAALPAVRFRLPASGEPYPWRLRSGKHEMLVGPGVVVAETDSIEAVADFARQGVGAALLPRYLIEHDIDAGALVEIRLGKGEFRGPEAHLCFVARARMPARVQALCDFLIERLPARLMAV